MSGKQTSVPYEVEIYTPERIAEFLLTGACDEKEYQDAREAVREMGLDPDLITHIRAFDF